MSRAPPMRVEASAPVSASRRRISEIAVRMRAGRGEADDGVPGARAAAVDDAVALDDADAETREVVVALGVHAGHLGGLAADQRAARHARSPRRCPRSRARRPRPTAGRSRSSRGRTAARRPGPRRRSRTSRPGPGRRRRAGRCRSRAGAWCRRRRCRRPAPGASSGPRESRSWRRSRRCRPAPRAACVRAHARLDALDEFLAGIDVDAGIPIGQRGAFGHRREVGPGWTGPSGGQCTIVA